MKRFWNKVDKSGKCWEWTAAKTKGYGQLRIGNRMIYAHRLAWKLTNGDIPDGLCVCHVCDNTGCVNPDHLFLGSHADNMEDRDIKGRAASMVGNFNSRAKLCEVDVCLIRDLDARNKDIAEWLNIPLGTVGNIRSRVTWKHLQ